MDLAKFGLEPWLLEAQVQQQRGRLITAIGRIIKREFKLEPPFKAVKYPHGDLARGKLSFKPGEKELLIWGTIIWRTENWHEGNEVDIGVFVGPYAALIVSDRDDVPEKLRRLIVRADGSFHSVTE